MSSTKHIFALLSALSLACSPPPQEEDPVCGRGERVSDTQETTFVCVYSSNLLIETGFECPSEVGYEIPYDGGVICSPTSTIPPSLEGQIEDAGWAITEPGMCMGVLCDGTQTCVQNECVSRDSCKVTGCDPGDACVEDTCEPTGCPLGCSVLAECINGECVPTSTGCVDALEPNDEPGQAVDVSYNTPEELGGLCADGDVDWFRMSVKEGDVVELSFREILFGSMTLNVYTYNNRSLNPLIARRSTDLETAPGRQLSFELSPTSALSDDFVIPADVGSILLEVSGDRSERVNPMRLTSVCGDANEPMNDESFSGAVVDTSPIAGHTCRAEDLDWFRVPAQPGQRLELAITNPDSSPVEVLLYEDNDGPTPGSLLEMTDSMGQNWGASMRTTGTLSLDIPAGFSSNQIYVQVRLESPGPYELSATWE